VVLISACPRIELKQDCAEGEIAVNDMLQRIEVFENRKKVGKK